MTELEKAERKYRVTERVEHRSRAAYLRAKADALEALNAWLDLQIGDITTAELLRKGLDRIRRK